jgi:translation initiation factor 2 subunit 3
LRRLVGVKTERQKEGSEESKSSSKVTKLKVDEMLMINIGSTSLGGKILSVKGDIAKI